MKDKRLFTVGLFELLTCIFIALKLMGTISWSWKLVLLPILLKLGFLGAVALVVAVVMIIDDINKSK